MNSYQLWSNSNLFNYKENAYPVSLPQNFSKQPPFTAAQNISVSSSRQFPVRSEKGKPRRSEKEEKFIQERCLHIARQIAALPPPKTSAENPAVASSPSQKSNSSPHASSSSSLAPVPNASH